MTLAEPEQPATPTRVVVVLLDSLNRHLLGAYGGVDADLTRRTAVPLPEARPAGNPHQHAGHHETDAAERLRDALESVDAPPHQLARLGLS